MHVLSFLTFLLHVIGLSTFIFALYIGCEKCTQLMEEDIYCCFISNLYVLCVPDS